MPLNFPDDWGIRETWLSIKKKQEKTSKNTKKSNIRRIENHNEVLCPSCGRWVRYFRYAADSTEYGRIYPDMTMDCMDTEGGSVFEVVCPECDSHIFDNYADMEEYVEGERP